MAGPTIRLTFAGDASDLIRALTGAGAATMSFQERVDRASNFVIKSAALMSAGVSAAAVGIGVALAGLPLAVGGLGIAIAAQNEQVKASFTSLKDHVNARLQEMARPFESVLIGIAGKAQETFDRLSPSITRMFETAAPLVDRFATVLLRVVEDIMPGFETAFNAGLPAVNALMDGIAGLGPAISQFFTNLSAGAEGGATAVTVLFDVLNTLIPILGTVIGFIGQWSGVLLPLAGIIGGVGLAIKIVNATILAWSVISGVATAATNILAAGARILWAALAANPIGLVITVIGLLVAALIYAWNNSETFRNVVLSVWAAVKNAITVAVNAIIAAINWFGTLPGKFSGWFNAAKDFAISAFNNLLSFIGSVPGRILGLLGNLGSLLVNAGRSLVDGFLSGIKSAWDSVVSFVKQGIQWVRNLFPFSPAKDGPLSGRGYVSYSGKALTEDFAKSLHDGMGAVGAAARGVVAAAEAPFSGTSLAMSARTAVMGSATTGGSSAAIGAPQVTVGVFIDGKEFKGMVRTEISESNRATRAAALSGRGSR